MLHRANEIILSQECRQQDCYEATKPQHLRDATLQHLLVLLNGKIALYYDCHDSYEIDEDSAKDVDFYFKRSYAPAKVPLSLRAKVFPLGLNYPVCSAEFESFEQQRVIAFEPELLDSNLPAFRPTVKKMYSKPTRVADPRVLFIARAWDPWDVPNRSAEKITERIQLNETRARCIELLRKEFGGRFLGGFEHTDYAKRKYGGVLLEDNRNSVKDHYIALIRQYPICVATTGLHGSIGWKMGEYVAFSRAIVSERLRYQIPGDFQAGENYLQFDEPTQCIEEVNKLFSDAALRQRMMERNREYYLNYLRPDAMVRRTLEIGLLARRRTY